MQINLESVLSGGHDGWVQSLRWHPKKLQLLSASMDKNVIIWEPNEYDSIWTPKVKFLISYFKIALHPLLSTYFKNIYFLTLA